MSEIHLTSVPHEEYGFSFSVRHIRADRLRLAGELAALWVPGASEETRAWLRDGLLEAAPPALLHGLGALAMPDVEGSYAEVRVPTYLINNSGGQVEMSARSPQHAVLVGLTDPHVVCQCRGVS